MRPATKTRAAAPRIAVAIPAGGIGTRFGSRIPKQFLTIQRVPVVTKTVSWFTRCPGVAAIVVAAPEAHVGRTRRALAALARRVPLAVVPGGPTRQDSVWLAMQAVPNDVEIVVVHDAVRPLITPDLIASVVRAAAEHGAAICALPIAETVKRVRDDVDVRAAGRRGAGAPPAEARLWFVEATLDRSELWAVQTPQAFRREVLERALDQPDEVVGAATDDAALVEAMGGTVRLVPAPRENLKITTPLDMRVAEMLLRERVAGGAPRG
jgi:2-C-methyl-D-erythritol 4-phosphate cytidylyltransferase